MIRVSKTRLFALLFLLVAGSCTETYVEEDDIPLHALKEVDAGFILNVLANRTPVTRSITFTPDGTIESDTLAVGAGDSVRTKAASPLSEMQESQIASLWVGQYDVETGTRLFNQYIPSMTGTTVNLKLKQSQTGSRSRVYFVSNAGDLGAIATEAILKKHTLAYSSTSEGLPDNNLCKMMGYWEGEVAADGVKDIKVELTRLIAAITFTYSTSDDFTFRPTSLVLKNAPTLSQVEAPTEQLTTGGIGYNTYTGTVNEAGATTYWYLPENMAGTVSGANAVDSEKKKTGRGVTNATCIELTGTAVQGGVTYGDVTFRFYPGSDKNNYDIVRNSRYTMDVTLIGIDISDERITVGKIPPIVVDPAEMPAKKGGEKEIQITARPGQPWEFDMPDWLSALLDGQNIPSGATITHQGPANVVFRAEKANPKAESRSVSFNIKVNGVDQEITIVQAGSTLTKDSDISLKAEADSEGASAFTATEGLQWLASLSGDGWLDWSAFNPGSSGTEAPDGAQPLKVKATTSNPLARARSGKITVKAGASVGDAGYTNLTQEIEVLQAGSIVTGSAVDLSAEAASNQASAFVATAGLDWVANVTNGDWIKLVGTTSGNLTTGNPQNLTFDVEVNPNSSLRSGEITIRAGDETDGPTGKIVIKQKASVFSVSPKVLELEKTTASGEVMVTGTSGLPWSVNFLEGSSDIVPDIISSVANGLSQTLTFNATENKRVARFAKFTIAVTGGDHVDTVKVSQKGSITNFVIVDQAIATAYSNTVNDLYEYPPFNYDGGILEGVVGSDYKGNSSTATIATPYTIEVESTQSTSGYAYNATAKGYCTSKGEGWRLPTTIEYYAMWVKCKGSNSNATDEEVESVALGEKFLSGRNYWTSSVSGNTSSRRCVFGFSSGNPDGGYTYGTQYIRCVRDIE